MDPAYAAELSVSGYRCFKSLTILSFRDAKEHPARWNIILGDNGTGKSSLLDIISLLFLRRDSTAFSDGLSKDLLGLFKGSTEAAVSFLLTATTDSPDEYMSSIFFSRNGEEVEWEQTNPYLSPNIIGYGADRSRAKVASQGANRFLLGHGQLTDPDAWLMNADYAAIVASDVQEEMRARKDSVIASLLRILPGISNIRIAPPDHRRPTPSVLYHTPTGEVPFERLGYGYQTVIAWVVDLAARMHGFYPDSRTPLAEPVVVLVDEIDLHLHPRWQRQIMQYLSEIFPKAQFIVTSHSPLIALAAPDANLAVLKLQGNEVIVLNDVDHVRNWRVDQVLTSDLFGLDSARGPEVEKLLAERKSILTQGHLTQQDQQRLAALDAKLGPLPTAERPEEERAMQLIRQAAAALKKEGRTG